MSAKKTLSYLLKIKEVLKSVHSLLINSCRIDMLKVLIKYKQGT